VPIDHRDADESQQRAEGPPADEIGRQVHALHDARDPDDRDQ
jgi:hypothetical protein